MPKRGRGPDGQKKRWSDTKKMKTMAQEWGVSASSLKSAKSKKGSGEVDAEEVYSRQGKKDAKFAAKRAAAAEAFKGKRKSGTKEPKKKRIKLKMKDEMGDDLVELDFSDSEDEEEVEMRQKVAKSQLEASEKEAKLRLSVRILGLPFSTSAKDAKKLLARCGEITDFSYPKNDKGERKGMAVVTFDCKAAVENALEYDGRDYQEFYICMKN
ncbi:unnamed protein product [Polarella glacialis]|uniref:RRM domain-containing protein n=1 Tax=Polarella glacialis TaxID=89957 RepID=A0A813L761_POLGL|nr:unnamed protein product [Polarella glacialis]